ncbi:MAG: four-carbon acid sugar kinase family protein [Bacteroidales bacterium]|nr:four-carbon acid sugar kinase family protein [Bacteroidales bacterium]
MIIVIADDITGAAEIAGIGHSYGLKTTLVTRVPQKAPDCEVLVVASDTRSMSEKDAVHVTHKVCTALREMVAGTGMPLGEKHILFKKVDSALRGYVVSELNMLMSDLPYRKVLYMPANPSRQRVIRGGRYFIKGVPIDGTPFENDPEFPITTSSVCLQLGISAGSGILVADAENEEDLLRCINVAKSQHALLAGAADLFSSLLQHLGHKAPLQVSEPQAGVLDETGATLIVCGSTMSTDLSRQPFVQRRRLPLSSMPRTVFDGEEGTAEWMATINARHLTKSSMQLATNGLVLNIPFESSKTKEQALRLRSTMAEVVAQLVDKLHPTEIVLEGGSTAFAVIKALHWSRFRLTQQISPGVVRMESLESPGTHLTLKPGSYAWNNLFA